ncbi:MAG: TonB-dependent receptor plug domain-containing protein [Pseudomonadales bacterium]|nr:TonB-dependent receptor plug domain-containing protein [Pseudomonadales bacterium]
MHVNRKTGRPGFPKKMLCSAVSLSLLPISGAVLAQDDVVEEVIVTGSFIRRTEGFRSASPLTQLTLEDIAAEGTPNIGDIVHSLSFNQGSSISSNITPGSGASETAINLRGLGAGATLDLVDGKRVIDGNVNAMLPQIAIQRLDIVVDGAAALYGSAAVAGVVNFVPIKSYDGFKMEVFSQETDASDSYTEQMYSFIWGGDLGGVDLVVAGQWRDNSNLLWADRENFYNAGFNFSSSGNPGQFAVPQRDENGILTGTTSRQGDLGCTPIAQMTDPTVGIRANPNGNLASNNTCYMDFGQWWELNPANQQGVFYANASYEVSDDLSFNLQANWNSLTYKGQNSAANPGGRVDELPVLRGELPGNPYRAMDANGNALFALDANADTLPDRDANGDVILDPNGIPFNEDVRFSGWRPFGKSQTPAAGLNSNGSFPGFYRERSYRVALDTNFTVPYIDGWDGVFSVMHTEEHLLSRQNNQSFPAISQGLNCDTLGPIEECFNPFAVNPDVLRPYTNSQQVADSIFPTQLLRNITDSSLSTMDLVFNGTVPLPNDWELPGGPIGMAIGAQRRRNGFDHIPAALYQSGDLYNGQQDLPANESRTVDAWFVEVALPILDNLELTAATRDTRYSTGQSSSDPKFGITYSPTDWLTVRGTKGTAFIAPSLNDLNAPERCNLSNIDDPLSSFFAYARRCQGGNPFLTPETADTLSFGITVEPLDNLRIDLDWSQTEFTDRIVSIDPQQLLDIDYFNWSQWSGISGREPTVPELQAWVDSGNMDPRVIRSATDPTQILRVTVGQSNAAANNVEAFDLKVRYQFELDAITGLFGLNDVGTMTANLGATKIDLWEYQKFVTDPVSEPLGKRNRFLGEAPPLPELKGNLRLGWVMGNHSASITGHYVDEIEYDGYNWGSSFFNQFPFFTGFDNSQRDMLRAFTSADIAYNYRGLEVMGTNVDLTLGSRNVFDRMPQRVNDFAGMESILYDPRGRMIYGRVTVEF